MIRIFLLIAATTLSACGGEAQTAAAPQAAKTEAATYACPMHPDIKAETAIACSKCGMPLEKQAGHDHGAHEH